MMGVGDLRDSPCGQGNTEQILTNWHFLGMRWNMDGDLDARNLDIVFPSASNMLEGWDKSVLLGTSFASG